MHFRTSDVDFAAGNWRTRNPGDKMKLGNNTARQMMLPGISPLPPFAKVSTDKLPTNMTTNRHAVHRWFNFVAGFAPEFVAQHCPSVTGGLLLDPFSGCGTALVVARSLGHRAVGFEPHPFFARIAKAKTSACPSLARLESIEAILLDGIHVPRPIDSLPFAAGVFLKKLFDEPALTQLLGARDALEAAEMVEDDIAFLLLSRVIDMCSKSKTDGIYKAPTSRKHATTPVDAIRYVVEQVRYDTGSLIQAGEAPPATLHPTSSEDMRFVKTGSVDVAVTSPPYLNNFDFAEMTRMYLYFWGMCGSWKEITQIVRSKLIVNTTTALAGHRENQQQYRAEIVPSLLSHLDTIVNSLAYERTIRAGKKEYDRLVFPYFAQMARVLMETLRCLRMGGEVHVVVADAAFYGIHVDTPQVLAATMSELGYKSVKCTKLRDRGQRWILKKRDGSPTGLGEYYLSARRGYET